MSSAVVVDNDLVLEAAIALGKSFALYRLPNEDEPYLMVQDGGDLITPGSFEELADKSGFLMAPFKISTSSPMMVLRPDHLIRGREQISSYLQSLSAESEVSAWLERYAGSAAAATAKDAAAGQSQSSLSTGDSNSSCTAPCCFAQDHEQLWEEQQTLYRRDFEVFHEALNSHRFDKLVLSTRKVLKYRPFLAFSSFDHACSLYRRMMVSLVSSPVTGTWLGATPEILLRGRDQQYQTMSLAGTMINKSHDCCNENDPYDLSEWSTKDRQEQEYVTDYIREVITPYAQDIREEGPYTTMAGPVRHLRTDFAFTFRDESRLGELIGRLHPTPAVCGLPKQEAYSFIVEHESIDRRYYAGMLGPLNLGGDSQLYVNLRCMEITFPEPGSNQCVLASCYAGGGNLRQSVCESELTEACNKMRAVTSAIVNPASEA